MWSGNRCHYSRGLRGRWNALSERVVTLTSRPEVAIHLRVPADRDLFWGAQAARLLVAAARRNKLSISHFIRRKVRDGGPPSPAGEPPALPGSPRALFIARTLRRLRVRRASGRALPRRNEANRSTGSGLIWCARLSARPQPME